MVRSFLSGYIKTFNHWAYGLWMAFSNIPSFLKAMYLSKPASFEISSDRLTTCYGCDRLDLITNQCKECWCFIRLKVQWLDESCPLGKWPNT